MDIIAVTVPFLTRAYPSPPRLPVPHDQCSILMELGHELAAVFSLPASVSLSIPSQFNAASFPLPHLFQCRLVFAITLRILIPYTFTHSFFPQGMKPVATLTRAGRCTHPPPLGSGASEPWRRLRTSSRGCDLDHSVDLRSCELSDTGRLNAWIEDYIFSNVHIPHRLLVIKDVYIIFCGFRVCFVL